MCRSLSEAVRMWTVANNFKTNFKPKAEPKVQVSLWMKVGGIKDGEVTVTRGKKFWRVQNKDLRNTYTNSRGISQVAVAPELAAMMVT